MRYRIQPPWRLADTDHIGRDIITTEVCDLLDTRTGDVFRDGAYRVKSTSRHHTRIFRGETAWMDAERYARDIHWELRLIA